MNTTWFTSIRRLLTIGCLVALVAACGGSSEAPAPTTGPVVEAPPTAAAPTTVVISVGINAEFQPFVYVDEAGRVTGFDIDLMNALAQAGGFEFGFVDLSFDQLLDGVTNGEIDAAISAITVTAERQQQFDFTDPYFGQEQAAVSYFSGGQGLAVRTANTTTMDISGLTAETKVGVKAGTTGASFVASETQAEVVAYPEAQPALAALAGGEVDAVVLDIPVLANYIKSNPTAGVKLVGRPLTQEQYAIAVTKGKPEVLALLNEALANVRKSGAYDAIVQKWFGTP